MYHNKNFEIPFSICVLGAYPNFFRAFKILAEVLITSPFCFFRYIILAFIFNCFCNSETSFLRCTGLLLPKL